jgi:hypothetical protein
LHLAEQLVGGDPTLSPHGYAVHTVAVAACGTT